MGLFDKQFANVVEWEEYRDDVIFWKWTNREIKKGSRLIVKPGQDAIFMYNGVIEGIFKEEGSFDIETDIIPFLSTLKGFKFGFNSGMRAEVLFVNTKEFTVKWGTKNTVNIPTPSLPGGMPIRENGIFEFKVEDYIALIDKVAGVKSTYLVEDVKQRIIALLDQLLMKWISKEGKDMFNLMANSFDIGNGIKQDLDMQLMDSGIRITAFNIMSVSYPESVQKMIEKTASQSMVGDMNRYSQMAMVDAMSNGKMAGGSAATDMAGMMMGMQMAGQMMNNMGMGMNNGMQGGMMNNGMQQGGMMNNQMQGNMPNQAAGGAKPKFCPNCGTPTGDSNFCPNCGNKLV